MSWTLRPRGLRARLVVAFVLVTVAGATAAAWSSARSASTALVTSNQQRLTASTADQLAAITPELSYPPDQAALDRIRIAVGENTLVTFRGMQSADGAAGLVPGTLRTAVQEQRQMVAQRITAEGKPWLLIGTPIMTTAVNGSRTPSGIEVYSVRDLTAVEQEIDSLTRTAVATSALALLPAVFLALLAARSVLRPVRDLRDTARRLADGDLSARTAPQGADELAALTDTVNEMAASLQDSMVTMQRMQSDARRFAADVSHELRTPLSTLTAVVEVLAGTTAGMEPDARESAELAVTETERLVRLVEDLMEVSRFDAGTAGLRLEETNLADAVRDCLRARNWLDQVDLVAADNVVLRCDRRRLDVIVANLVGNAFRHGEPPVLVRISVTQEEAAVEVTDNGPGLSEMVLPHVFDRFYKADAARTRTPGSGLGLAIALENARLHSGDLTASNNAHGGARFTLLLPRGLEKL
ncbi:HAMP domain-containing histidine kinase [Kribbella antibiotica]|uniref:histidine kinase n=1 Tax=Kribbella antibiotica TaxID=190195 RepID=A0A4R4ZQY2_9ACTN|nr:HAMP domain-containing sensor histidine kinase [Kribbella antibiotica]TDD61388.1 HAMP domain-containing histidine kinase [Kribbella antibiotica]